MGEFELQVSIVGTNFNCVVTFTEGTVIMGTFALSLTTLLDTAATGTISLDNNLTFGVTTADGQNTCQVLGVAYVETTKLIAGTIKIDPPSSSPATIVIIGDGWSQLGSYNLPAKHGSGTFSLKVGNDPGVTSVVRATGSRLLRAAGTLRRLQ